MTNYCAGYICSKFLKYPFQIGMRKRDDAWMSCRVYCHPLLKTNICGESATRRLTTHRWYPFQLPYTVSLNRDRVHSTGQCTISNFDLSIILDPKPCWHAQWTRPISIRLNSTWEWYSEISVEPLVSVPQTCSSWMSVFNLTGIRV